MSGDSQEIRAHLRDWLVPRGPSFKADFAKEIGITPRHLNRVLQGTRNLSAEAKERVLAAIEIESRPGPALRSWLHQHSMTVSEFAQRLGIPPKTVEDWVYRERTPSVKNCLLVFSLTGLSQYARETELRNRKSTRFQERQVDERLDSEMLAADGRSKRASASVYRLIRELYALAQGPRLGRDEFRRRVAGADVGYLRSILAALLDEEQLEDWKRMSSYRLRGGGKP